MVVVQLARLVVRRDGRVVAHHLERRIDRPPPAAPLLNLEADLRNRLQHVRVLAMKGQGRGFHLIGGLDRRLEVEIGRGRRHRRRGEDNIGR